MNAARYSPSVNKPSSWRSEKASTLACADGEPGDLDLWQVEELGVEVAVYPLLGVDPRRNDRDATGVEVRGEPGNRLPQSRHGQGVADRAAETEHRVEPAAQVERRHVCKMQRHAG
jgi:hypothetical protein